MEQNHTFLAKSSKSLKWSRIPLDGCDKPEKKVFVEPKNVILLNLGMFITIEKKY